ncbi:MAG: transglutaminase domain-containing protein [Bacteroidales bacterium]|nr:transglutaminase domain-containing protein [Bacteroidales bacterium]
MKNNATRLILLCTVLLFVGCRQDPHFIADRSYRAEVHTDFETRMEQFPMLDVRLDTLSRSEREAMEFLYAYMPLSDMADYEPQFFLDQVRTSLRAREEMPWGKAVPDDIFRHFVLVYRVNNENLDTARQVFFRELKERVSGMTMEEAALEVNHWCHERVAYRASDARTSSPLATMRTSLGRCGEESTFTVTALRAVGIPARQCYTPRWAHCDDNHAWVEVYVGGEWKFMGACEPDPQLDMGWFSVPSTRCMMVHSKAFGRYKGDEEVVRRTQLFSELNLLSHYAPTRRVTVMVTDSEGRPLPGAKVKFKLYNYAEYYPLSTQIADAEGKASLTTGLGDLLVWATDGSRYAFEKIDVRQDSTMTLVLAENSNPQFPVLNFEIVPPVAGAPKVVATDEEMAANARRLAYEDSLRNAYTATFPTKDYFQQLEGVQHLNKEQQEMFWQLVCKSEGNYEVIINFILKHGCGEKQFGAAYEYLKSFSDKDLRDITAEVLEAHYLPYDWDWMEEQDCTIEVTTGVYIKGIVPARISNEMVRPYREELSRFKGMTAEEIRRWVVDNIVVDDTSNYFGCPLSPVGVYKLRRADSHSRDIFFVAACRAAAVPAYLDNATNIVYAWDGAQWQSVGLSAKTTAVAPTATLTLTYRGKEPAKPLYWPHFTIAKLENGDLRTFDFEDDPRMSTFPATIQLEPGTYCLSTGNRYPDGAVRSRLEFFEAKAGEKVVKEIVIMPLLARTDELGVVDRNLELFDGIALWDYAGSTGMLYINLGSYAEPSKHLVVELKQLQSELKQWGGMTYMVGPSGLDMQQWQLANTDIAYRSGELEKAIVSAARIEGPVSYPLVALITGRGQIVYLSQGYKIGLAEQVLKASRGVSA